MSIMSISTTIGFTPRRHESLSMQEVLMSEYTILQHLDNVRFVYMQDARFNIIIIMHICLSMDYKQAQRR